MKKRVREREKYRYTTCTVCATKKVTLMMRPVHVRARTLRMNIQVAHVLQLNLLAQHPHTCRNVRVHPHTLDTQSTMLGTAGTACVDIILINSVPKHVRGARIMSIAFLCGTYMYMYMYCTSEIMVVRKAVDKENVNIIIL